MSRRWQGDSTPASDGGFTLVEMLVAMSIFAVLGTVMLSVVMGARASTVSSNQAHDINEESRVAMNRISRELRQAIVISAVQNPDGSAFSTTSVTFVTFKADFNGDKCIDGVAIAAVGSVTCMAADPNQPEQLTYCYDPDPSRQQLSIVPGMLALGSTTCDPAGSGALPILAGHVTGFKLEYRSNAYLWDANADGVTTWSELDAADPPVGDHDGNINTGELANVDSVVINLSMLEGLHRQSYRTQVDLRNLSR